jgi:hypothetical protein
MSTKSVENNTRMKHFMSVALGNMSTMSQPDPNVMLKDIAFAVDHLDIAPDTVKTIKRDMVQKTPLLALVYTLGTRTSIEQRPIQMTKIVETLSISSDSEARVYLLQELGSLESIVDAATIGKLSTDYYRTKVWKLFTNTLNDPQHDSMPPTVSDQIQHAVIKRRCGVGPTFLQHATNPILHFNDLFVTGNNAIEHPLNSKDQLCPVIRDLNTMADKNLADTINNCVRLLGDFTPSALNFTSESPEYKKMCSDVKSFGDMINRWEDITLYACDDTKECVSKSEKLKLVADQIRKYAASCTATIDTRRKLNMKSRIANKDPSVTKYDQFKSWFS